MRQHVVELDLSGVTAPSQLHALIATSLGFPEWYGHNWNAFWDAITGLVEMPVTLRLRGWEEFETRLPGDAHSMRESLNRMSSTYPTWASHVVYA